jgi:hypothetical protein
MRFTDHSRIGSLIVAIALGGIAGHVALAFGGSFTWVVWWLLGLVLCPLLICFIMPSHRLLNAVLANLAMLGVPALDGLALRCVRPFAPGSNLPEVTNSEVPTLTVLSVISVLFALAVVGAFESHRER